MLVTVEKKMNQEIEVKKIHKEDLSYYLSTGWKLSSLPVPETYKKGRKRSED